MISLADFFPAGRVEFVKPPFDERFWSNFGIPARVQVTKWGTECARGLQYSTKGTEHAGPGQRKTFGGSRKARGYASGTDGKF